jgi:transposase
MAARKHRVVLSAEERAHLLEWIGRGSASARELTRARILLKADEGPGGPAWPDVQIAEALELSAGGVAGVRRRFGERGLRGCVERKRPARDYATKLDGAQEARLIQLACTEAPQGYAQWSLRLLAGRLVELGVVDTISHETVRQTLKKTPSSPISGGNG